MYFLKHYLAAQYFCLFLAIVQLVTLNHKKIGFLPSDQKNYFSNNNNKARDTSELNLNFSSSLLISCPLYSCSFPNTSKVKPKLILSFHSIAIPLQFQQLQH